MIENLYQILRESVCVEACQNYYKHCYNCETIEIYKVTLNTCEKLKMTRETQLDLWEYEVKGQCSCYCVPECVNMSQLG